ncbi:MAG TPA: PQQ-dependent sugar dehydrogenase [Nitrososphaeraceae archaeon]|nr:PQQ-dependent sugar dehydrogenase [Nitrososphaeraceae archaeon]
MRVLPENNKLLLFFPLAILLILTTVSSGHASKNIPDVNIAIGSETPRIIDPFLRVETVAEGLEFPTTMAFLGPEDILVLEKEKGTVQRIVNGKMLSEPLLDVNVGASQERCMCGIAVSRGIPGHTYVFLYFTEIESADREDVSQGNDPIGNRLYRYEFVNNNTLVNPKLLLDLPAVPGPRHNGGAIMVGPDNNLYIPIGDVDGSFNPKGHFIRTMTQNYLNSTLVDGRSGILRVNFDGKPITGQEILGDKHPLNYYYAYGIRNSFGIDFDPVTGNLWDTENGPAYGDEINLVRPGFNSGYYPVQGIWSHGVDPKSNISTWKIASTNPGTFVNFGGKGNYSAPEFIWADTVGVTAVKFFHSNRLGEDYKDDMFVGSIVKGDIYHFDLNRNRTQLILSGDLKDKIAETSETGVENTVFGENFAGISDLEVGPDGYLYVVSLGQGKIFKIVPSN